MRRVRTIRTGPLFLAMVVALATMGVGYGLWSDNLFIRGEISTGTVTAEFDRAFTDDDGSVDEPLLDGNDVGNCPIQAGGDSSCDPAASGADPKPRHDKDVALCTADVINSDLGIIKKSGVYPGYFCTAWFGVHNDGSVPIRIAEAKVNGSPVVPGVATPFDLDGDGADDVKVHLTGIDVCQQIDPDETVLMDVDQEILQDASQARNLTYAIEVTVQQWNEECAPTTLPTYTVATAGLSEAQAADLANAFAIPADSLMTENGAAYFTDPATFQAVPMEQMGEMEPDEDDGPVLGEGFDFGAIQQIQPLDAKTAMERTQRNLAAVQLTPDNALPAVQHTMFEAYSVEGNPIVEGSLIDTQVLYSFSLNGIGLIGPMAQVQVSFTPTGAVSSLTHAAYGLSQADNAPVMPPTEAARKCSDLLGRNANVSPTLTYYAPAGLGEGAPIIPHYDCAGTTGEANLLQQLIPALSDPAFVPEVELEAAAEGNKVVAQAIVTGGTPPYNFSWGSSSTDLSGFPEDMDAIEYAVFAKDGVGGVAVPEGVAVTVTDANGITAYDAETVQVTPAGGPAIAADDPGILVAGVVDFGIERAVSDMCSSNVNRYSNRMDDEAVKRFHWTGQTAWERDFKGSFAHDTYVDNVDQTFYCGHGWGGGFTFESNQDDGSIVTTDPRQTPGGDWGDKDLEWLALLSCQVLKGEHNGQQWYQRWGPAFDGLHLLLGFETNAYDWPNFGKRFAEYQQGRFFGAFPVLPVRAAWFQAAAEEQPSGVKSVVMGVIGPNGLSNYNDYFHGNGPVGPDIRGSDIRGYWRVVRTTS
jgi:hypothetical protein